MQSLHHCYRTALHNDDRNQRNNCPEQRRAVGERDTDEPFGVVVEPCIHLTDVGLHVVNVVAESHLESIHVLAEEVDVTGAGDVGPSAGWEVFHQDVGHVVS